MDIKKLKCICLREYKCLFGEYEYKYKNEYEICGKNYEWKHKTMDFEMARDLCLDIFYTVKNSTMMSINYTYVFQLLYNQVPFERIKRIIDYGNQKLIRDNEFSQRRKGYIQ